MQNRTMSTSKAACMGVCMQTGAGLCADDMWANTVGSQPWGTPGTNCGVPKGEWTPPQGVPAIMARLGQAHGWMAVGSVNNECVTCPSHAAYNVGLPDA